MFGFNKKKRMIEGPVEFAAEVDVDRPASEVFPLVDIGDPRFKDEQMGATVTAEAGAQDRFELRAEGMEGVVFRFHVLERVEGSLHKVEAWSDPKINALVKSVEEYRIVPLGADSCKVHLITQATFDEDLSDDDVVAEAALMNMAVMGDLEKIKTLAEDGLEAAKALDGAGQDIEIDFEGIDLDDLDINWDDIETEQ